MFDPIPELSSDLDWMLQSGQASNAMLAQALVDEYYDSIYRLALGIFDDPDSAYIATQETFISALLNVYRFHEKDGVQIWFFQNFFEVCRRVSKHFRKDHARESAGSPGVQTNADSRRSDVALQRYINALNQNTRKVVLMHYLLGMRTSEISSILRTSEKTVRSKLKDARREFLLTNFLSDLESGTQKEKGAQTYPQADILDQRLAQLLKERYPSPDFSSEEIDREIEIVLNRVGKLGARRRSFTSLKELLWIGLAIFLVVGVIWGMNNLLPNEADSQAEQVASTGKTKPTRTPEPSLTPLSVTRQAILPPTQEPLPTPVPEDVFYIVQPGDTLEFIAANMGVSVDELLNFNRIASAGDIRPGTRLVIPSSFPTVSPHLATPVTPASQFEPLSTPSSSNGIMQFLRRSTANMSTIWVDAQVIDYGPEGYVGPPIVSRNQLWLSDTQFLALHGPVSGSPQEVYLRTEGDLYLAKPGMDIPWFFPLRGDVPTEDSAVQDLNLLFNTLFASFPRRSSINFRITGSDTIAGWQTWLIEKTNSQSELENLLWADTKTGFILRNQEFGGSNQGTVLKEVRVTAIAYDIDFPQNDLFNPNLPWRGGFARDYNGGPELASRVQPTSEPPMGHEPLPYVPALSKFDPSRSTLTFQYPQAFSSTESLADVSLFAGGFYLGNVEFGNPWTMICARSPDGAKIAFVSQPFKSDTQDASLYWFSLLQSKEGLKRPLGDIQVTQLAFAPDSRRIAAFGYNGQSDTGAVYIIDTQNGEVRSIHNQGDVKSLVWSPDGQFLAFIGRDAPPNYEDHVIVIRVDTGEVTFSSSIDMESNRGSSKWPPMEWDVAFPVEMGGLENCSLPPEN